MKAVAPDVCESLDFEDTESPQDDAGLVAYRAGKGAFLEGLMLDHNPHDGGTALAEDWELGWITAAESDTTPGSNGGR
jgi:hypothetical protein